MYNLLICEVGNLTKAHEERRSLRGTVTECSMQGHFRTLGSLPYYIGFYEDGLLRFRKKPCWNSSRVRYYRPYFACNCWPYSTADFRTVLNCSAGIRLPNELPPPLPLPHISVSGACCEYAGDWLMILPVLSPSPGPPRRPSLTCPRPDLTPAPAPPGRG